MSGEIPAGASTTYALISHESAVEAIWSLAQRKWKGVLDNEGIWLVPDSDYCVKTQGEFKELAKEVSLVELGIRHMPVDLLVPNKSCFSRGKRARFHVWKDSFPPNSFVKIRDRIFVSTPYFTVLQLAVSRRADGQTLAHAEAEAAEDARLGAELGVEGEALTADQLTRWGNIARLARATQVLCDFMGTYRFIPSASTAESGYADVEYQTKPLISPEAFDAYLTQMHKVRGIIRARRVAELAFAQSASPMETALALMLTLPVEMGGFGLPRPQLNREAPIDPALRDLSSKDTIIADLCWPDQRVVIEYYGWDEHFGAGPGKVAADAARANSLTALGWTVLHASFEQVRTIAGVSLLARQLASLLGAPLVTPSKLERIWRTRLWALLLPKLNRSL